MRVGFGCRFWVCRIQITYTQIYTTNLIPPTTPRLTTLYYTSTTRMLSVLTYLRLVVMVGYV